MLRATTACHFSRLQPRKSVRPRDVLCILTCHSGVRFLDIWTSKITKALRATAACDFWTSELQKLQMCFAPQRRASFGHLNFKNCSANVVFCAFWLTNVLRATAACHFSFLCWTSGTANHWKNAAIRDFPNIWHMCICFLVILLACWSSFCWLDFSTLPFKCPYCRKLDF